LSPEFPALYNLYKSKQLGGLTEEFAEIMTKFSEMLKPIASDKG
jgi:hypothetical protein